MLVEDSLLKRNYGGAAFLKAFIFYMTFEDFLKSVQ